MRRRPLIVVAGVALAAFLGWRLAASRLEGRVAARIESFAARHGAQARADEVRVSLWPPLRLRGLRLEKPGLGEARIEEVSVRPRAFGRAGLRPYYRVTLGAAVVNLPAGLVVRLQPSSWDTDSEAWAELVEPVAGLHIARSAMNGERRLQATAAQLATDRLGLLMAGGAPVLELGEVDGEARWASHAQGGVEAAWQGNAIGASSTAEIRLAPGTSALDLSAAVDGLRFDRLFAALGLDPVPGMPSLGSLRAAVHAAGPLADPAAIAVTQRIDYTPPPEIPKDVLRLRGEFIHDAAAPDGTRRSVAVSPSSSDFIARGDVPPLFVRALLLAEDTAFYSHPGVDLTELPKALAANLAHGSPVRGGSTITQQLAKNLFLSREKSVARKVQELPLAFLLESALGKERILEIYLNVIEWGPALYGLRPAARHYFGKEPAALTPKETAFLVVLIPGPVRYQRSFTEGALTPGLEPLVANLLAKLRSVDALSEEDYAAALAETLVFRRPETASSSEPANETAPPEEPAVLPYDDPPAAIGGPTIR
jgi:hypothetical protein